MSDFRIDARQLKRLDKSLSKAGKDYRKGAKRFLKEIGSMIQILASKYAPISPNKGQYKRTLKGGKTTRANTSFTSGALQDAIIFEVGKDQVSIGVPSNTPAGKYAEKIHEEKGKSWKKRGVATVAKGPKADEKYIYRAADDRADKVDELLDKVIDDMIAEIGI